MKTMLPTALLRILAPMLGTVINTKASLPSLRCVRITSGGSMFRIEATDLDRTVVVQVGPDDPTPDFDAFVEWIKIKDTINRDFAEIDLVNHDGKWLGDIRSAKDGVSYKDEILAFDDTEGWPHIESFIKGCDTGWHPVDGTFQRDYTASRPLASDDPTRYTIMGILLETADKQFVSTNGRALVTIENRSLPTFPETTRGSLILPSHGFLSCDLLKDRDGEIRFGTTYDYDQDGPESKKFVSPENRIPEHFEYRTEIGAVKIFFWSRLIEGNYPNWRQVIPKHTGHATVTFLDPSAALKQLRTFKLKRTDYVTINAFERSVRFTTGKASFETPATSDGVRVINIGVGYLDYLLASGFKTVQILDERSPMVGIRDGQQLIVMPCSTAEMKKADTMAEAA